MLQSFNSKSKIPHKPCSEMKAMFNNFFYNDILFFQKIEKYI